MIHYEGDTATIVAPDVLSYTQDVIEIVQAGYTIGFSHVNTCPQMIGHQYYAQAVRAGEVIFSTEIVEQDEVKVVDDVKQEDEAKEVETPKRRGRAAKAE